MNDLAESIKTKNLNQLKTALNSGANPNEFITFGSSESEMRPSFACLWENWPVGAMALLEAGANPAYSAYPHEGHNLALFIADSTLKGLNPLSETYPLLELINQTSPSLFTSRHKGRTFLSILLSSCPIEDDDDDGFDLLNALISFGCDPTELDADGSGLLMSLIDYSPRIVRFLLNKQVDVNAGNGESTPLHRIVKNHDSSDHGLCEMLTAGASVTVLDNHGKQPKNYLIYPFQMKWRQRLEDFEEAEELLSEGGITPEEVLLSDIFGKPWRLK